MAKLQRFRTPTLTGYPMGNYEVIVAADHDHREDELLTEINQLYMTRERLIELLKEYRETHSKSHYAYYPCDLCKRVDKELR